MSPHIAIEVDSTSLPEETEIVKLIASELIRNGVPKVSFLTAAGSDTVDQSALTDLDTSRINTPATIRQRPQ